MLLQLGDFQYVVRSGAQPKVWTWSVYHPAAETGDPIQQGEFRGSEGRAHIAAREAISRLREKRATGRPASDGRNRGADPADAGSTKDRTPAPAGKTE